MTAQYNT